MYVRQNLPVLTNCVSSFVNKAINGIKLFKSGVLEFGKSHLLGIISETAFAFDRFFD